MSKIYDKGVITDFNDKKNKLFFRKIINNSNSIIDNELLICKKIMELPTPKKFLINVYNVDIQNHQSFVDIELLDTNITENKFIELNGINDIHKGLEILHSLGIIYIDFKLDNIGYSEKDKCFKLFDFDCSGLIDTNSKWILEPFKGYNYNNALNNNYFGENQDKLKGDWYLFNNFIKSIQ